MTDRPKSMIPEWALRPRGSILAIAFQPEIKLSSKMGFEFAGKLTDYVDPRRVEISEDQWNFSQPEGQSPRGVLSVTVTPSTIIIATAFSDTIIERQEIRLIEILRRFQEMFDPKFILRHETTVRATYPLGRDAREFLAREVMQLAEERISLIGRPIHVVGFNMVCPPDPTEVQTRDSILTVRVESLVEDPQQIYLEARAQWITPHPWTPENAEGVVKKVNVVQDYLRMNVVRMVKGKHDDDVE